MSEKHYCDRCNKQIYTYTKKTFFGLIPYYAHDKVYAFGWDRQYEICLSCRNSLKKWFEQLEDTEK